MACSKGHTALAEFLLSKGATMNHKGLVRKAVVGCSFSCNDATPFVENLMIPAARFNFTWWHDTPNCH